MNLNNNSTANIPLSLYIHTPWCIKKCPYCGFNSYKLTDKLPEQEYITALLRDLENDLNKAQGRHLVSVFFGGGTPSLFSADGIFALLKKISACIAFAPNIEITLEANPSTLEQKYLSAYKQAGITRVSLGAQSFQPDKLHILGRIHSINETFSSLEKIKQANFNSFNIDLMHGLPGQTINDALFDLQTAISCKPQHISWYELTIEPGTVFHTMRVQLPHEDIRMQIQEQGLNLLQQMGFIRYEVSAFAIPQYQCLHNINYWEFGDYIGIGAGAHSKITNLITHEIHRYKKKQQPKAYLSSKQSYIEEKEILATKQIPVEFMLNALRLTNGFQKSLFQERTNLPLSNINAILETAENMKLLSITKDKIIPTNLGTMFLNDLLQLFIK